MDDDTDCNACCWPHTETKTRVAKISCLGSVLMVQENRQKNNNYKNMVTAPVERRRVDHHFQGFHKYVKQKTLKKPVKKTNAHTSLLKKIGVFYWRRAQFLHHQSFRYGETHILKKMSPENFVKMRQLVRNHVSLLTSISSMVLFIICMLQPYIDTSIQTILFCGLAHVLQQCLFLALCVLSFPISNCTVMLSAQISKF